MNIKKHHRLVSLILVLCAILSATAFGDRADSDAKQQVKFLTGFYKEYLSRPRIGMDFHLPPGSFYSRETQRLMAANDDVCNVLSRGDEICGYGVDGDVFLSAQEIGPDLNFEKSQFKASGSGKNTVDVSFSVWPDYGEYYYRRLRYVLVKEEAGWRVDDVFSERDGAFPATESMRYQINQENERVFTQARNVFEVLSWVFIYLSNQDTLDRVERSIAFPVRLCDKAGNCQAVPKGDMKVKQTMRDLHRAFYQGAHDYTTNWSEFFPKNNPERVVEGATVTMDAFELTFQGKAWWVTKIDLQRIGQTLPVQLVRKPLHSSKS